MLDGLQQKVNIQRATIAQLYAELSGNATLFSIYQSIDSFKQDCLGATISRFEKNTNTNQEIIYPYINAIEQRMPFGFSWKDFAAATQASFHVNPAAANVYASMIDAEKIFPIIVRGLRSLDAAILHQEMQHILSNYTDNMWDFFDENNIINEDGIRVILEHFNILCPAPADHLEKLMARQTPLANDLFAQTRLAPNNIQTKIAKIERSMPMPGVAFAHWSSNSNRSSILDYGFKNQHQTGASGGCYFPRKRMAIESSRLGMSIQDYIFQLPVDSRPKFVKIVPEYFYLETTHYGDDIWVLKDNVSEHMTFTFGGSSADTANKMHKKKIDYSIGEGLTPQEWHDVYLPWKDFSPLIPLFTHRSMEIASKKTAVIPFFSVLRLSSKEKFVEGQIFGPLPPESIKQLIFTGRVPNPSELSTLGRLGIRVFDGRTGFRKEFTYYHMDKMNDVCIGTRYLENGPKSKEVNREFCYIPPQNIILHNESFSYSSKINEPFFGHSILVGAAVYKGKQYVGQLNRFIDKLYFNNVHKFALRDASGNFSAKYFSNYNIETDRTYIATDISKKFSVGESVKLVNKKGNFTIKSFLTNWKVLVFSNDDENQELLVKSVNSLKKNSSTRLRKIAQKINDQLF